MIKKLLLALFVVIGCSVFLHQSAAAHVLISDETKNIGAVLHIVPDDDPIAGQKSNLFFDVQTQNINKDTTRLTITNVATSETTQVPIKVDASSVTADYTFPAQGVYTLTLSVSSDKTYTFSHSQRVSRGVTGSALDRAEYPLAKLVLVFSISGFLVLLIIMFNHRKDIKKYSSF